MSYDRDAVKLKGRVHPFLAALKASEMTMSDLSREIGVTPQSVHGWTKRCAANRHFLLPAEQVRGICKTLGLAPHDLRPDVFKADWL